MTSSPDSGPPAAALVARVQVAQKASVDAAHVVVACHGRLKEIGHKGAIDFVTEADRGSEAIIVAALVAAFPEDRIIGEEGAASGPEAADWCWYVDPLDGTTNYVSGLPHFAVSIGATWRGVPTVGVVLAPATGHLYVAASGLGAQRRDLTPWTLVDVGTPVRKLAANDARQLGEVLAATGFPYRRIDILDTLMGGVARALTHCRGVRRLGSAALDLTLVAEGVFGVFWERRLKPWDLMAGVVIVREAGGVVTDLAGGDDLMTGAIAASGPHLHRLLLDDIVAEPS